MNNGVCLVFALRLPSHFAAAALMQLFDSCVNTDMYGKRRFLSLLFLLSESATLIGYVHCVQ